MQIIVWNCRGIASKIHELPALINEGNVICLSETMLKLGAKYKPNLKGYNFIRQDRQAGEGRGLLIFIKNSISYSRINVLDIPNGVEIIGVKLTFSSELINLFSLYIPPQTAISKTSLDTLLQQFEGYPRAIITGDLNAQHKHWGSTISNPRGNILFDILLYYSIVDIVSSTILNSQLKLLNNGKPMRLYKVDSSISAPDISLASIDIAISIK